MKLGYYASILGVFLALPSTAADDPLSTLGFLVGRWSGGAAEAAGTDVFQRELDGHVLQRHSQSVIAATDGKPRSSMQAQLTIYPTGEGEALAAVYFDSQGHVIHYSHISVTPGERVELLSDGSPSSPAFRLTYSLKSRGVLHVKFEMQPPGKSTFASVAEADEAASAAR